MTVRDSKSVASDRRAPASPCPYLRSRLTAGGAVAGAGILALSLVAVPPDAKSAKVEVRAAQLAYFASPAAFSSRGLLENSIEKFISEQARAVAPFAAAVKRGAPDITTAATTSRLTFDSAINPALTNQVVDNAALGSVLALGGGVSIPALILSAGLLAFVFGVLIPAGYLLGFIGYNIIDPILGVPNELAAARASTATVDENHSAAMGYSVSDTEDPAVAAKIATGDVSSSAATAPNLYENLLPVFGPVILFGPIAVGLFVLAPAIFVYDSIAPLIGLPTFTEWQLSTARTTTASVEPKGINARFSTDNQEEGNSLTATMTAAGTPDETPGDKTGTRVNPLPVISNNSLKLTDTLTQTGQATSIELTNEQISTDTESLADDPSEPAKPTPGSATHRPLLRGLFEVGERVRDLVHLGNRGGSTAPAATAEKSPPTSSPTGEDAPGGSASDGDADGS